MQKQVIDFIHKEAKKYRDAAKIEPEQLMKKTDLKAAAFFDLIEMMLTDYLVNESMDRSNILDRYREPYEKEPEKAS